MYMCECVGERVQHPVATHLGGVWPGRRCGGLGSGGWAVWTLSQPELPSVGGRQAICGASGTFIYTCLTQHGAAFSSGVALEAPSATALHPYIAMH